MKVIACAHDPGGANAVAAVIAALRAKGTEVEGYAKGPAVRQFLQLGIECVPVSGDHRVIFAGLSGDLLLTGTSQYDDFERAALRWARGKGVPSITVIDYWSNYLQRFQSDDSSGAGPVFPNIITAIDNICAEEMITDGLPEDRILITGQPYFSWLIANREPKKSITTPAQHILFASQPGLNEIEILRILINVLTDYKPLMNLLVRFHPRQGMYQPSLDLLNKSGLPFVVDESPDLLETLRRQDIVLGITSAILIEAAMMGIAAGSVIIGVEDTLKTNNMGVTIPLTSPEQISAFLYEGAKGERGEGFIEEQRGANLRIACLCHDVYANANAV
jgi:hypothetical protein